MAGTRTHFGELDCGVAQAIEQIGDAWTLLILRNAFMGMTRYDDFVAHLSISTKVLADRLSRLVENGILERREQARDGRAADYRLTAKGLDLYPLILALNDWGEKWAPNPAGRRIKLVEKSTGKAIRRAAVFGQEGGPLRPQQVRIEPGPGAGDVYRELIAVLARRQNP